jgi:outer membrane receptor for ferrienterochelin and colicins
MAIDLPKGRQASVAMRYFYEDRWGGQMQWTKPFRGTDSIYGESIYTNRLELIGNYPLPVTENLQFAWSYNYHHQDSWYGKVPFMATQQIGFGQLLWNKALRTHDLLAGLAARYTIYDDNSPATMDPTGTRNQPDKVLLPGLFVQDEWKLTAKHTLLTGLRADHHPEHGLIFTPRLAYKWNLGNAGVFRFNAGTGFRVVNLFTEEHAALTGSRQVVVAEDLKPEQSVNVNLNHFLRIPFYHAFLTIDASLWFTHFSNQIIPDYDSNPNQIIYSNLDGYARSQGASLNLEYNWKNRFRAQAGMTLQDIRQTRENADGKMVTARPVLTESWSAVWAIGYRFPDAGFSIDYTGNLYGPMRLPLLGPLDPRRPESPVWSIQNIQLTKRMGRSFECYGGVKNILDWTPDRGNPFLIARADDPFDKGVEFDANGQVLQTPSNPYALTFDPTYVFAPNQGRRLFIGLRWTLQDRQGTGLAVKK